MRVPGVRLRWRLRGMLLLVAGFGVLLWGLLWFVSPVRRLEGLTGRGQPGYTRYEGAALLGSEIPSWETGKAVDLLIGALSDPEPTVRKSAQAKGSLLIALESYTG